MMNTPTWTSAAFAGFILALVGSFAPGLHAAGGRVQEGPPQGAGAPPQADRSEAVSSPDQTGPSSNADAKTGREHGLGGASPEDAAPSLDDLQLGEPGQRAKVLGEL